MPRRLPRTSRDRVDRTRVSLREGKSPPRIRGRLFPHTHFLGPGQDDGIPSKREKVLPEFGEDFYHNSLKRSSADHDWKTSPIEGCALSVWHVPLGSVSAPAHAIVSGEKHGIRASRRASVVASDRAPGGADASTSPPHIRLARAHEGWGAMSHLSSRRASVHVSRRAACPSPLQVFLWQRSPVHAPSRSLRLPIRSFPSTKNSRIL